MHIANITSASLDGQIEPIDLGQTPGDVIVLSFSNSDLRALMRAHESHGKDDNGDMRGEHQSETAVDLPTMRLAALNDLRHPMSVDLWIDKVAQHARVIVVRILGGYDWWPYGCDQLAAIARRYNIALALLPGESHEHDARLADRSTCTREDQAALLALFRAGGAHKMTALLVKLTQLAAAEQMPAPALRPVPTPNLKPNLKPGPEPTTTTPMAAPSPHQIDAPPAQMGFYAPERGIVSIDDAKKAAAAQPARPIILLLFYRAILLSGETAPIDALAASLATNGLHAVPIFVPTLKSQDVAAFIRGTAKTLPPAAIVTTTAFAISTHDNARSLFDDLGVPVLQAIIATTRREAWLTGARGLITSDIAMNVVLPELDGRLLSGVLSFKQLADQSTCDAGNTGAGQDDSTSVDDGNDDSGRDISGPATAPKPGGPLQFNATINRPEPDRIDMISARLAALIKLRQTPAAQRRITIIMPDYPGADGRTGYAVGLDVPASVLALLSDLSDAGYQVQQAPQTSRALLNALQDAKPGLTAQDWPEAFAALPQAAHDAVTDAWGPPPTAKAYAFRYATFGNITVALAPDRGHVDDRRAGYHDPQMPPCHELLAFGHWLQHHRNNHAVIHCGAHGTFEWLPGKAVALSAACFPELVSGALPVIYPFIVNNPGEAAQAKRRICALTIGHMPPPMIGAGLTPAQQELERLVDEYVQADGLDARRQQRLAQLILAKAASTNQDRAAGITPGEAEPEALARIDTWLCDLKDFAIKDGQHIYGRAEPGCSDPGRLQSAQSERDNILAALDGRFVPPGPAGSPSRGRADIYPTGRNLFTIDPRMMPTPVAFEMGSAAADEVLALYLQDHGEWPRALVIDLWASAALRTGGEDIAQGLALLGCRPQWDHTTGRITGIEVLPPAAIGRPRIDVTWRISGLFRDMFPAQIALMSTAIAAIAKRGIEAGDNALAAEFEQTGRLPQRIFGSSPGTYGTGIEYLLQSNTVKDRDDLGRAYLAGGAYAFSGFEGAATFAPDDFAARIAAADLLVHTSDDSGHDLLEGSADVAYMGGFAAAIESLGGKADLICLDTTDPAKPRARSLADALRRTINARAINPRYIRGQMRHGPRGASDFAETVDRLVDFAQTTDAVPGELIDALYDAYVADENVRAFLLRENPEAAAAIAARLNKALQGGLWHPRRNSTQDQLLALRDDARAARVAGVAEAVGVADAENAATPKLPVGEDG